MKLAPRDSLNVDRRIPVTEVRHQLLFKTQKNFFRENLTMDNSLREKRHQQDGSSCKKLKVENKSCVQSITLQLMTYFRHRYPPVHILRKPTRSKNR